MFNDLPNIQTPNIDYSLVTIKKKTPKHKLNQRFIEFLRDMELNSNDQKENIRKFALNTY